MPKRKHGDKDSDAYILRKIRKLSQKLRRRRATSTSSSSDSEHYGLENQSVNNRTLDSLNDNELLEDTGRTRHVATPVDVDIVVDPELPPKTSNFNQDEPASVNEAVSQGNTTTPLLELDQEILDILGETPSKDKKYGPSIQNDLAVRWNYIAVNGLSKESRKEYVEKSLTPDNCKSIDAPILNDEAKAASSEALVKKDKAIEQKQKQRAAALSCLGEAITKLLSSGAKDVAWIKPLIIASRLICDLQHNDSMVRRSFICSAIKKEIKDHLYKTNIDKYLFGEKLPDTLKAAKFINKSVADMKIQSQTKPTAKKPYLNSKAPLPNSRQPEATRRQEPAPGPSRPRPQLTPGPLSAAARPQRQQPRSQVFQNRRR